MNTPVFKLRFPKSDIPSYAEKYSYTNLNLDNNILKSITPAAKKRGWISRAEFLTICRWKSPRIIHHCEKNSDSLIREATWTAFAAKNEELRIGILTALHGVKWPVASSILHLCHRDKYPIIDFRALWSVGIQKPPTVYTFSFWWKYVEFCRKLSSDLGISMRMLDRALWQYSKTNQQT